MTGYAVRFHPCRRGSIDATPETDYHGSEAVFERIPPQERKYVMKLPVLLTIILIALAPAALCRTSAREPPAPRMETSPIPCHSPLPGAGGGKSQSPEFPDHEIPTTPANLRDHLLSRVKTCQTMIGNAAPENADGRMDIIDDVANGYVQVSAEWPPCGCNCKVTAAAFKSSDGSYTIMHMEEWGCSWTRRVAAYPPLHVIFPEDLTIAAFIPPADGETGDGTAWFYLDAGLPRVGTDVKLTIRTIPFGMRMESQGLLAYGYAEADGASNCTMLFRIRDMAEHLDEAALETVMAGRLDLLSPEAGAAVRSVIGDDASRFRSVEDLSGHLKRLWRIYDLYCRIEHEWVVLAWEREKATFYIRDRGPAVTPPSFREFLLREQYWSPEC